MTPPQTDAVDVISLDGNMKTQRQNIIANSRNVQRLCPSGARLQAIARRLLKEVGDLVFQESCADCYMAFLASQFTEQ